MKSSSWVLLFLALGATFVTEVRGEDAEYNDEDLEEFDEDAEDDFHEVSTHFIFPDHKDMRFPVGKEVTVLVDVSNNGQEVFNVTRVATFLHSPYDLSYFIQNCTAKELSGVAAPNTQISLEYKFTPDMKLEALEYWLSGYVEYTVEGSDELFMQVFVNSTVHLYDDKAGVDIFNTFTTLLMVATIGAMAYGAFSVAAAKTGLKKKKKYVPPAPVAASDADDWEVNTYKQSDKSRAAGGGRRNKRNVSKK